MKESLKEMGKRTSVMVLTGDSFEGDGEKKNSLPKSLLSKVVSRKSLKIVPHFTNSVDCDGKVTEKSSGLVSSLDSGSTAERMSSLCESLPVPVINANPPYGFSVEEEEIGGRMESAKSNVPVNSADCFIVFEEGFDGK